METTFPPLEDPVGRDAQQTSLGDKEEAIKHHDHDPGRRKRRYKDHRESNWHVVTRLPSVPVGVGIRHFDEAEDG